MNFFLPIRHFLIIICCFLAFGTFAQRDFSKIEINSEKITENIYLLKGSGGNIGVCVGEKGVLMIDSQFAPLSDKIKAAIKKLSDQPIHYLVNTHWHGDHTGGNENINSDQILLIAHDNVYERMSKENLMKAFSRTVPAAPEKARPELTFSDKMTLRFGGEAVMVFHVDNAHTDGDAMVYFANSNVLHMGDTFFNGRYPFIDLSSGGSVDGLLNAINTAIMVVDEDTKIIPGHGDLASKKDLLKYREVVLTVRDRVRGAIKEGKSLEMIQAAKLNSDYDEKWGSGFINGERIIDIMYTSLTTEMGIEVKEEEK